MFKLADTHIPILVTVTLKKTTTKMAFTNNNHKGSSSLYKTTNYDTLKLIDCIFSTVEATECDHFRTDTNNNQMKTGNFYLVVIIKIH